jgi:intein/homing endonuclease
VATEHGLKPIQEIHAGERVWAFDHASESWRLCSVLECYQSLHQGEFIVLRVAGETIETTKGHPFWVIEGAGLSQRRQTEHSPHAPANARAPGRWIDAGDLQVGDVLLLKEGKPSRISELATRPACERVYNFNVEELHCYAVGAGQILVHNNSAVIDEAPGGNGGNPRGRCFPASTPVATEKGLQPIQEIRIGERVWACDHATGEWQLCAVLECYRSMHEGELIVLGAGGETIESTKGHPFWVIEGPGVGQRHPPQHAPQAPAQSRVPGRWVDAGDLQVGDVLLLKDSKPSRITELRTRRTKEYVYNFHVADLHCYAVGASQILVHNNSAKAPEESQGPGIATPSYDPTSFGDAARSTRDGWMEAGGEVVDSVGNMFAHPGDTLKGLILRQMQDALDPLQTRQLKANAEFLLKLQENPSKALGKIGFQFAFAAATMRAAQAAEGLIGNKGLGGCFAAGTPLRIPDGSRAIDELRAGDWVLAAPEGDDKGDIRPRRIVQVFSRLAGTISVTIGGRCIRTTAEHPFWVQGQGWTEAMKLKKGDCLRSLDGQTVQVESWEDNGELELVHNVEVSEDHTYFVGGFDWAFSVWAHNIGDCPKTGAAPRLPNSNAADLARYRAALSQQEIEGAPRIGSALKSDPMHRAPTFVIGQIGDDATVFGITGGDGVKRTLTQMPGWVNGQAGVFEWIIEDGNLVHQRFIPGAPVSGVPNLNPSNFPR